MRRHLPLLGAIALLTWAAGCGKKHPIAPVTVPPLDSIVVSPSILSLFVGQSGAFTAVGFDTTGTMVPGIPFRWTSTDTLGITIRVDAVGRVRAISEGTVMVFAEAGGARDSAEVIVGPASSGWFAQTSNANGANLYGVYFLPDGQRGWAVGDAGKILATQDAGYHWAVQASNSLFSLKGVWFTSPVKGWAVGAGGTVLHTVNGGLVWNRVDAGAGELLEDVTFASDSMGWAVGSAGVILRTRNEGRTWDRIHPTPYTLHSVAFHDTSDGWAVGEAGLILGTHNGGASWFIVQPSVTAQPLEAVWRTSESVAYAVGAQGVALRTIHPLADTTRWELRVTGAANQLEGVSFPNDSVGYAIGFLDVGLILKTGNRGITWQTQAPNVQVRLEDVFFVDPIRGWAVGNGGTILHTGTGGE